MSPIFAFCLLVPIVSYTCCLPSVHAKVFLVLMEEDPVVSYRANQEHLRSNEDVQTYKESAINAHDILLESLLPNGSFTKLYSYTHLLNGFAVHADSEEAFGLLEKLDGVRAVQEDMKMEKMTTHTPDFLGIPTGVWPKLSGAENSGRGVVIGLIDTGINPLHPSFTSQSQEDEFSSSFTEFRGRCEWGEGFPQASCSGKIAGAQYFARAAIASGDFNATRDYASPFDADGHGSHTASIAAGNHQTPVVVNGYSYGSASGMAPGARIAVYKAVYSFGGYMSDVVAAIDQAVEDGVDILSLSIGPASVPQGAAAFLNVLEMELLFATRAGVVVVQAAGNGGPASSSVLSFSPWIVSVAASNTDRKYNNSIDLGNGRSLPGVGLSPPTSSGDQAQLPIAAAVDVSERNRSLTSIQSCQNPESFIRSMVRGKLIICIYAFDFEFNPGNLAAIVDTIRRVGAAGFILTMDPQVGPQQAVGTATTFPVPGIVLNSLQASTALWDYYNSNTNRNKNGGVVHFGATARILDGRRAIFTGKPPIVAFYSSRGPDVNNALMQTADVLKPNLLAPGSSIWGAWSPLSEGDHYIKGQSFALLSGTSMAAPHIAGIAALIKQRHPHWSPAAIASALMTSADTTDPDGGAIAVQLASRLTVGTPFDYGSGFVNPTRAMDPGLVFDAKFSHYIRFLCAVPGVDEESVRRATGGDCPESSSGQTWCSDLNAPSVTISNLVGTRKVGRKVTSVAEAEETYRVAVRPPTGVTVKVKPLVFTISPNATLGIKMAFQATQGGNGFSFGELVMEGDRNHVVRVPLAVSVTSVIGPSEKLH